MPDINGKLIEIKSDYRNQFNDGNICRYKVNFPSSATQGSKLALSVEDLSRADVFAVETSRYTSS